MHQLLSNCYLVKIFATLSNNSHHISYQVSRAFDFIYAYALSCFACNSFFERRFNVFLCILTFAFAKVNNFLHSFSSRTCASHIALNMFLTHASERYYQSSSAIILSLPKICHVCSIEVNMLHMPSAVAKQCISSHIAHSSEVLQDTSVSSLSASIFL